MVLDLEATGWEVVGKNDKVDVFPPAPPLIRAFRIYRRRQLSEAERRPAMRDALADPEKAYVLMTINGRKSSPSTVTKIAAWHGIRAGVGLKKATPGIASLRADQVRQGAGSADGDAGEVAPADRGGDRP